MHRSNVNRSNHDANRRDRSTCSSEHAATSKKEENWNVTRTTSEEPGITMVKSLGNIIAQDDSRGDASSVAIVVIDIGSSGVDPCSFPCIHATRYEFVGTP